MKMDINGVYMIPLKIETLLTGKVVEQNRVEYKSGWNPGETIRTICAFANDYPNVNGGYIVIGVAEKDGMPILPPVGVPKDQLDSIQKQIFEYCNRIEPRYIPAIEVVDYPDEDTHLIYLKCSPGDSGPYQAPVDVYSKAKADRAMQYWIRPVSLTVAARKDEIAELYEKFNSIPFDDRVNRKADLSCIRRGYLEDFLRISDSSLAVNINQMSLEDILTSLEVANETDTGIELRNIAVLMFSEHPEKYIPGATIELVWFHTEEAEGSDEFTEKLFTGPIWKQVQDVLDYINTNIITEKVVKITGKAEAERFFNYPYNALEEVLVNAVFHKSYRDDVPVNVRIYTDRIEVINYPGPDRWIDMDKFAAGKIRSRKYRNRRIGEMFKEIDLSEKQGTGITKILRTLKANGSPVPEFDTVEDRVYLSTVIRMHEGFEVPQNEAINDVINEAINEALTENERLVLKLIKEDQEISIPRIAKNANLSKATIDRVVKTLKEKGVITREGAKKNGRWIVL